MWNRTKTSLLFILVILSIGLVSSAYYVTDPENCPNNYQSQTCSGSNLVCGYSGGVTYCYDMSSLNAPAGSTTTTGTGGSDYTCSDTTCNGGFITDCYAYDGSEPHCDNSGNFWCDRNPTCYNKHVQTTCTGGAFVTSSCSATCTTNYFQCDGDTTDADGCEIHAGDSCGSGTGTIVNNQCYSSTAGNCTSSTRLDCDDSDSDGNTATCNAGNGCEVLNGGACEIAGLDGTYDGCTCVVSKSYFETGTNVSYSTTSEQNFLWGNDFGLGWLIKLIHIGGGYSFEVNSTGAFFNGTNLLDGGGSGDNESWNESYANTLYAGIEWDYNQTEGANDYTDTIVTDNNASWSTTYNATYDAITGGNASWNQSYADTLYSAILWAYNQTIATFNLYNSTWDNSFMNIWNYNQTLATFSNYNSTWDQSYLNKWNYNQTTATYSMYNNDWNSTYNATYDAITGMDYTNVALINKTNVFAENQNFSKNITLLEDSLICLNTGCTRWIKSNGSGTYIQG